MMLPTMPQDDLEEIQKVIDANRGSENPTFYRCPNGHPYLIGNCGRAATPGNCSACGEKIGAVVYNTPLPGNAKDTGLDTTQRGHILGKANVDDVREIYPERDLGSLPCTILRLLVHMAMFLGPVDEVQTVINPKVDKENVPEFLLDHIRENMISLQRAMERSSDDIMLFIHHIIENIAYKSGTQVPSEITSLQSKSDRKIWEREFSLSILQDIIPRADELLEKFNNVLATDERFGADPLMALIYETGSHQETEDTENLVNHPKVWRYRTQISVQHMRRELEASGLQGEKPPLVLHRFIKEDHILRALRFLPNIMNMQRIILHKFQKKLDKSEANSINIKSVKKELYAGPNTGKWINEFSCVWEICRQSLEQYACPSEFGLLTVPQEFCTRPINDEMPMSVLLPSTAGPGLCSYIMLDFFFRKQNDFLDNYMRESGRRRDTMQNVKPMAVTSAHLISYDHENDLMPLVLANCHYSFEMGVGTKIEYDFAGMERQLMDRLLYSKPKIYIHQYLEVDQMVYRTEVTNHAVLERLAEKIVQVQLNKAAQNQICDDLKSLPDVCKSLDSLDIAISFLNSTGGKPSEHLHTFMVTTLQMDSSILSNKARQFCELRHARALWLLLSQQKSKLLIDYLQSTEEVFETLPNEFYEDLGDDKKTVYTEYLNNLSIDKLSSLLDIMHEFLILNVAVRQNPQDEDYVDTSVYSFVDGLSEYASQSDLELDTAITDHFPREILYIHGANSWVWGHTILKKKIGVRRR